MTPPLSARSYYADAQVRQRLREYLGASCGGAPTARSLCAMTSDCPPPVTWEHAWRGDAADLDLVCDAGADISRGLFDSRSLIFFVELDDSNADSPGKPFLHAAETFADMEPAYAAVCEVLTRFGLLPSVLVSGRGYHFVGRIARDGPVDRCLAALAPDRTPEPGWAGMCCVVEHFAHLVIRAYSGGPLPLVVNGLPVGNTLKGRRAISIDFSYAGDPLAVRHIRCAFSTYQWHRFRPDIFGAEVSALEPLVVVPRGKASLGEMLRQGRTMDAAWRVAQRSSGEIPDVADGLTRLIADYAASPLRRFHRRFFAELATGAVGRLPPDLPACVQASLNRPNDLMLKPEHVQHVVRTLLARGWRAVDIAALVRRCYEAPHDWGDRWTARMNPAMRAAFEVRAFAGLVAAGVDELVDFNCVSAQEKGLCPRSGCRHDLRIDRSRLLETRP